jgi:hypothetical protein
MFDGTTGTVVSELDTITENPTIMEYKPNTNKLGYRFYQPVNSRIIYTDQINTILNVNGAQVFMYIDLVEYVYGSDNVNEVNESEYYYYQDTEDFTLFVYPRNDAYQVELRMSQNDKDVVHLTTNVEEFKIPEVVKSLLVIGNNVEVYDDIIERILGNDVIDEPKELITKFNKLRETGNFDDYLVETDAEKQDEEVSDAGE